MHRMVLRLFLGFAVFLGSASGAWSQGTGTLNPRTMMLLDVSVAIPGSPDNKYVSYRYTRHGSPAKLKPPKEAGEYELRYVMGQSKRVLARFPIVLE